MPILSKTLVGTPPVTSLPVICWDNILLESGTFASTGSGYADAFDWLTYDGWTTTATGGYIEFTASVAHAADYFAFAAHDLHLHAGSIQLEYHDGSSWVQVATAAPGTLSPMVLLFDSVASNRWRVTVASTSAATIGVICVGPRLSMPHGSYVGHAPARLGRVDRLLVEKSQGGQFLGRSVIRTGASETLAFEYLPPQWVRDYWQEFVDHAVEKPWFLLWNPERWPTEAAYCWTTGPIRTRNSHPNFMSADVNYEAQI